MNHNGFIIIDIETLSTEPNAMVFAIAAIDHQGKGFMHAVDLDEQRDAGADIDPHTVMWWITQDGKWADRKAADLTIMQRASVRDDLQALYSDALMDVWVRGPDFDLPILANYLGINRADLPWDYWRVRDVRTAEEVTGKIAGNRHPHNPYEDCLSAGIIVGQFYDIKRMEKERLEQINKDRNAAFDNAIAAAGGEIADKIN